MTTISTKQSDIEKKWILIDATDVVVGRLASFIAKRLRGKHLASFTPHSPTTQIGFEPMTDCLEGSCSTPLSY